MSTTATPSEPWRLIPESQGVHARSEHSPFDRLRTNNYRVPQFNRDDGADTLWAKEDDSRLKPQLDAETTCFAIRIYVVARDSKDSDSTHPAGYSTCQPTDRYRLKSTEMRVKSSDR